MEHTATGSVHRVEVDPAKSFPHLISPRKNSTSIMAGSKSESARRVLATNIPFSAASETFTGNARRMPCGFHGRQRLDEEACLAATRVRAIDGVAAIFTSTSLSGYWVRARLT